MTERRIARAFHRIADLPCWGLEVGSSRFMTLQFGEPHLVIREPIDAPNAAPRIRRRLASRTVKPVGDWFLWLYESHWTVWVGGRQRGGSGTRRSMTVAARILEGQKLIGIVVRSARTVFTFDLGAELRVRPISRGSDAWMFFEPRHKVLTFRGDGKFAYHADTLAPERAAWQSAD